MIGPLGDPQGRDHGLSQEIGIGQATQLRQPDTIGVALDAVGCHLEGEAGFAGPSGSGQGQEAGLVEGISHGAQLFIPTYEARELGGQVVGEPLQRAQRGETVGEIRVGRLVDVLGTSQVLEPVGPQIEEADVRGRVVSHQCMGGL